MMGRDPTMSRPNRSRAFLRPLFPLGLLAALAASTGLASLSGCKSVDLAGGPVDSTGQTADSAQVAITNNIEQDPDTLTFLLYPGNAVDFTNAATPKTLGAVPFKGTRRFRVPAGAWKLAYKDRAGNLTPMYDVNDPEQTWLKSLFVKNGDYALILKTDLDQTVWVPSFKTDPPMQ
jgi:hypothetical protein